MKTNIKTLKNKADKLFQEWGRATYTGCCLCPGEYSCLHHFIHRSQSLALRWDVCNGVPVCLKCHCRIHSKNDPIDIFKITDYMTGLFPQWIDYLRNRRNTVFKISKGRMLEVIQELQKHLTTA